MAKISSEQFLQKRKNEVDHLAMIASANIQNIALKSNCRNLLRITHRILKCKIAFISFKSYEFQNLKSAYGMSDDKIFRYTKIFDDFIKEDEIFVSQDLSLDKRFGDKPVISLSFVRFCAAIPFYLSSPINSLSQRPMGTLYVMDDKPRSSNEDQIEILSELAQMFETHLSAQLTSAQAVNLAKAQRVTLDKLDRTQRQFRQAERMANIGSWRLTLHDNQTQWSEQTYAIHGLPMGDGKGLDSALSFYPEAARAMVEAAVARTISTGEPYDLETDFITAQGELRRVRSIGELEMADGSPVALIGVFQDITSRHALEQTLRQVASTDELTRIANRARFNEIADLHIAKAKIDAQHSPALLLIDLDNFKTVNDNCGHLMGDDILRMTASCLQASYLAGSFAARLGGDEFVLIIDIKQFLCDFSFLLKSLLNDLRQLVNNDGTDMEVSATIGVCLLDENVLTREEWLERADVALYRAKHTRRGSAAIDGQNELVTSRQHTVPQLRLIG